jgi:hypothetical protein
MTRRRPQSWYSNLSRNGLKVPFATGAGLSIRFALDNTYA